MKYNKVSKFDEKFTYPKGRRRRSLPKMDDFYEDIYDTPISCTNLSVRLINMLESKGIFTLGDLVKMSDEDLLSIKNLGKKSLKQIKLIINSMN